jgi:hypothetical protein
MAKSDDHLQKKLFGEEKEMTMRIMKIYLFLKKKLMMILNFLYNYNKIYTGDNEKKDYYESWGELKIDIDFYTSIVFKDLRK